MVAIKHTLQEGKQKVKKKLIPSYFIPLTPYIYNHFRRLPENQSAAKIKANAIAARVPRAVHAFAEGSGRRHAGWSVMKATYDGSKSGLAGGTPAPMAFALILAAD